MIKKIWLLLICMTMAFAVSAGQFQEGKQYIKLDPPSENQPKILIFFSFYCPHCYVFEDILHVSKTIQDKLPDIPITKYHLDSIGPLGEEFSKAWAVAAALGVQDKVEPLLFEGVQKDRNIKTAQDIRNIFKQVGVDEQAYDSALNSFMVKAAIMKEKNAAKELKLTGVPAIFINGKYMLINSGFEAENAETSAKLMAQAVKYLLNKKD